MTCPQLETKTCQIDIPLPPQARALVSKDQVVEEGELLAEQEGDFQEFDLSKILKISPQNLTSCLLVSPGGKIEKDEIIAQRKSLLTKEVFKSPISGTVEALTKEGILKIRSGEKSQIKAPVKGKIRNQSSGFLTLEFTAAVLTGQAGDGATNWGEITFLAKRDQDISLSDLPEVSAGKIFILGGKIPVGFVYKAEALGAAGILGGLLPEETKPQDLAILVVGEKDGLISQDIWDNLKKYEGKRALISGSQKTLKIPL